MIRTDCELLAALAQPNTNVVALAMRSMDKRARRGSEDRAPSRQHGAERQQAGCVRGTWGTASIPAPTGSRCPHRGEQDPEGRVTVVGQQARPVVRGRKRAQRGAQGWSPGVPGGPPR